MLNTQFWSLQIPSATSHVMIQFCFNYHIYHIEHDVSSTAVSDQMYPFQLHCHLVETQPGGTQFK